MSPRAETARKRRAHRAEALFALGVLAAAAVLFALFGGFAPQAAGEGGEARTVATVARDGKVLETVDLSSVEAPYTFEVADVRGRNVVAVEPGRIRVVEADCPDRVCVDMGWIDGPGLPIACVPHGLAITVAVEGKGASDDLDATTR